MSVLPVYFWLRRLEELAHDPWPGETSVKLVINELKGRVPAILREDADLWVTQVTQRTPEDRKALRDAYRARIEASRARYEEVHTSLNGAPALPDVPDPADFQASEVSDDFEAPSSAKAAEELNIVCADEVETAVMPTPVEQVSEAVASFRPLADVQAAVDGETSAEGMGLLETLPLTPDLAVRGGGGDPDPPTDQDDLDI